MHLTDMEVKHKCNQALELGVPFGELCQALALLE